MADPRSPTEVAKFSTQFEAEAVAEVVRAEGIAATVFGGGSVLGGGLGVFGDWIVLVPGEDAQRARLVIISVREQNVPLGRVDRCPWCGYSLVGLELVPECPECGRGLDAARAATRTHGLVQSPQLPPAHYRTAMRWLWVAVASCGVVGIGALIWEMTGGPWHQAWLPAVWQSLPSLGVAALVIVAIIVVFRRSGVTMKRDDDDVTGKSQSEQGSSAPKG